MSIKESLSRSQPAKTDNKPTNERKKRLPIQFQSPIFEATKQFMNSGERTLDNNEMYSVS